LLSLPRLLARKIRGTKLLVEYLEIMWQKVIKKEVAKHIREAKRKEREERKDR
jgi:hypothetical protein